MQAMRSWCSCRARVSPSVIARNVGAAASGLMIGSSAMTVPRISCQKWEMVGMDDGAKGEKPTRSPHFNRPLGHRNRIALRAVGSAGLEHKGGDHGTGLILGVELALIVAERSAP